VGGITSDTYGEEHGPHHQVGSSPQDQGMRRTVLCSACTAWLREGILKIEIDLIGHARYRIPYNDYHVTD
jgi:hypothetical protein